MHNSNILFDVNHFVLPTQQCRKTRYLPSLEKKIRENRLQCNLVVSTLISRNVCEKDLGGNFCNFHTVFNKAMFLLAVFFFLTRHGYKYLMNCVVCLKVQLTRGKYMAKLLSLQLNTINLNKNIFDISNQQQ